MPPAASGNNLQVAVDLAEIKGQLGQLGEIKVTLLAIQSSVTGFREEYIREHAILEASTNKAHARIDEVYKEIDAIKGSLDELSKLAPVIRLIGWAVGVMAAPAVVGGMLWIWQLITHGGLILPQ